MAISPHTHRFDDDLYSKLEEMTKFPQTVTGHLHEAIKDYLIKLGDASLDTAPAKPRRAAKRFTKPDIPALSQYFHDKGSVVCMDDANAFFDYFETCGWVVGKAQKPMKDWKAAVRNWMRQGKKYEENKPGTAKGQNKRDEANRQRDADRDTIQGLAKQPYIESGGFLELHG